MRVTVTNRDLIESKEAFEKWLSLDPPPTMSITRRLLTNARLVEQRLQVIGESADKLKELQLDPVDYSKEVDELLDEEVEIEVELITYDELEACEEKREGFGVQPGVLFSTWFMLE